MTMKAKKTLTAALLLGLISLQSMGMGHPHNLFNARKQIKAKHGVTTAVTAPATGSSFDAAKICAYWVKVACMQLAKTI